MRAALVVVAFLVVGCVGHSPQQQQQSVSSGRQPAVVDHSQHGYRWNGPLTFECYKNGTWGEQHAPRCVERQKTLSFQFGVDSVFMCVLQFTAEEVNWLIDLIERRDEYKCRVRMTPGHDQFYVPFSIPIWGVVEASHIHVDNHLNMIFHAFQGSVIAAAAYPLRDQFAFVDKRGGTLSIHGHVKFFQGESFNALNSRAFSPFDAHSRENMSYVLTIVIWSICSFVITLLGATAFFFCRLKPDLVEKIRREKGPKGD